MGDLVKKYTDRISLIDKFEKYITIKATDKGAEHTLDPSAPLEAVKAYDRFMELGKDLEPIR